MVPTKVLQYIPQLSERTQYFDTQMILAARLDPETYYASPLKVWREVRTYMDVAESFYDHPPDSIHKHHGQPPLSSLGTRLRAVVTYKDLLGRLILRQRVNESIALVTVEVAKKTLDYLMLCYLKCSKEEIDRYLPENQDWFYEAEAVIRRQPNAPASTSAMGVQQNLTAVSGSGGHTINVDYDRAVESMIMNVSRGHKNCVEWKNIHGIESAKILLYESMVLALKGKEFPTENVLLFGPPGTGKTMMWMGAAQFAHWTVFNLVSDTLLQTYQGQSEKVIASLFNKARERQPSCIVIDEASYLFGRRSSHQSEGMMSVKCKLLTEMSNSMYDEDWRIMFVATTNRPADIDEGFVRRFQNCIYVKLPGRGSIMNIMKEQLSKYDLDDDVTTDRLHDLATLLATRRTLSGDDVVRALRAELRSLMRRSWFRTTHFREVTCADGKKELFSCSHSEPGPFQSRIYDLSDEQQRQLTTRKVKFAQIEKIMLKTMAVTSAADLKIYEDFDYAKGRRFFEE